MKIGFGFYSFYSDQILALFDDFSKWKMPAEV